MQTKYTCLDLESVEIKAGPSSAGGSAEGPAPMFLPTLNSHLPGTSAQRADPRPLGGATYFFSSPSSISSLPPPPSSFLHLPGESCHHQDQIEAGSADFCPNLVISVEIFLLRCHLPSLESSAFGLESPAFGLETPTTNFKIRLQSYPFRIPSQDGNGHEEADHPGCPRERHVSQCFWMVTQLTWLQARRRPSICRLSPRGSLSQSDESPPSIPAASEA